jgi:hypothetical protein
LRDRGNLVLASTRGGPVFSRYLRRVARHWLATRRIVGPRSIHLLIVRRRRLALRMHYRVLWITVHRHLRPHVGVELTGIRILRHLLVWTARGRLIIVWRHGSGRHIVSLRHCRWQSGTSVCRRRGCAELLLAIVSEVSRHATPSLVRGTSLEVGVGRVTHVLVVVIVVVVPATAAPCRREVSTAHSTLRGDWLVVHVCMAMARVSPHVRRGSRVMGHRWGSHVGTIAIATEATESHRIPLLSARRRPSAAGRVLRNRRR